MRKFLFSAFIISSLAVSAQSNVYFTSEITPESLVKVYEALGVEPTGKVAVRSLPESQAGAIIFVLNL